jgi:uncharacterized protein (TIRG00374 family)
MAVDTFAAARPSVAGHVVERTLVAEQPAALVERPTAPARPRWRRAGIVVSLLALPVAVWVAAPTLTEAEGALRRIAPGMLAAAMLVEVAALAALAQVYRAALRAVGPDIGYRRSLQTSMGAYTVSRVFPGGGAVGAVFAARRMTHFGATGPVATTAVLLAGTVAMTTLAVVVAGGGLLLWSTGAVSPVGALLIGSPVLTATVVAAIGHALWRSPDRRALLRTNVTRVCDRLHIDTGAWQTAFHRLTHESGGFRRLLPIAGWSAVNWLADAAALWLVFLGLGYQLEPGVLLAGYGAANLATALPVTPGGLGVVEAGTAGVFAALGVSPAAAVIAVIAYRVMAFWLPVAAGLGPYLQAVRGERHRVP